MEEKHNANGWQAVERYIFDSKEHKQLTESDLEGWSELSDLEKHLEAQAGRAARLNNRLKHLSRFLDYRSLRDRTRNPYAGNCLLVRESAEGDTKTTVSLVRRLDDIVPLRYGGAHCWVERDEYFIDEYFGRGEEIDSILDVNGKLLVRTVPDPDRFGYGNGYKNATPLELEIKQLTDKGDALIRRCEASFSPDPGYRLDSLRPWAWEFEIGDAEIDLLGKRFDNGADELLEELWDCAEYCQPPRYKERRLLLGAAFEYERPLGRKVQNLQVRETCDFGEPEPRFAVITSTDPLKRSFDRHDFDTMAEALAFCEEEYGLEIEA